MKTTVQYIDAIKLRCNVESDYAVAKLLGITRGAVSSYRTGRTYFDDLTALRAAELLGINPMEVIAAANAERAKNSETRSVWSATWDKFAVNFDVLRRKSGLCVSPALA